MKNMTESEYDRQANEFLRKYGINFTATYKGGKCPLFCDGKHIHGERYYITFSRPQTKQKFNLSFWNSLKDVEDGEKPTPYDVLTCIQKYDPGAFEDFYGDFGYDMDSRKVKKIYKAVLNEWGKVSGFFSQDELEELQEIN